MPGGGLKMYFLVRVLDSAYVECYGRTYAPVTIQATDLPSLVRLIPRLGLTNEGVPRQRSFQLWDSRALTALTSPS